MESEKPSLSRTDRHKRQLGADALWGIDSVAHCHETPEVESYVTKAKPTLEDWLEYNQSLFAALRGERIDEAPSYAPLADADVHAAEAGISVDEYFEQVKNRVGDLNGHELNLVHSDMDGSWHIIVD